MKKEQVITVTMKKESRRETDYIIEELNKLCEAAGCEVVLEVTADRRSVTPATFIGKGKAEELKRYSRIYDTKTLVFNHELTGIQMRNLEKITDCKIVDRTNLILDIFATRARSKESVLQVKLAQLEYRLPRLAGYKDYLSRLGGGIGTRGPGEQQLETDRRAIRLEIRNIKKKLEKIISSRETTRKRRNENPVPLVAAIGYTNAGKSTLSNRLVEFYTDKDEPFVVKDRLFQTLDTTIRRGKFSSGKEFLMADTVGFVRNLPTHLIEAFKSTLEELYYADVILHVVDSSNPDVDNQIATTEKIMKDMGISNRNTITVFNKSDKSSGIPLDYKYKSMESKIIMSAFNDEDIKRLLSAIENKLGYKYNEVTMRIPYDEQDKLSELLDRYKYKNLQYKSGYTEIQLYMNNTDIDKYSEFLSGE